MIKWSDNYSISNTIIDNQHKKISSQINKFMKLINLKKSTKDIKLEVDILEEIVGTHNKTEERYMKQYNYPEYEIHVEEHKVFNNNIRILKKALLDYGINDKLISMINSQAEEWNTKHILEFDKKLGDFLRKKGIK
ncbi:hemerythrin family protein [bacterium]|nr:hemerythrin family protein [bacterium]